MNPSLKSNRPLAYLISVSVFLILFAWAFLFLFFPKIPPELPWFYSLPWGEGQLIPKTGFLIGLSALTAINVLNGLLSYFFSKRDRVIANVIMAANILVTVLYLISFYKVLSVVTG